MLFRKECYVLCILLIVIQIQCILDILGDDIHDICDKSQDEIIII